MSRFGPDLELDDSWSQATPPTPLRLVAQELAVNETGELLLSGFSSGEDDRWEMWVREYTLDGDFQWESTYAGPNDQFGYGFGVAAGSRGAVAQTGLVQNADGKNTIAVRRLSP